MRDLGGRGHAEVRKVFVARDDDGFEAIHGFLRHTLRRGAARGVTWSSQAAVRLASLCAASASLPLALGPVALTDRAAELEVEVRRLYLDGGTLNNRPIAPALRLGRWHDELRMQAHKGEDGRYSLDAIRSELVYERVVFTLDAFPDHSRNEWRSPHPSEAFLAGHVPRLRPQAVDARNARIDEALEAPTHAFGVFTQSVMSSLRAHDMRNIAKLNRHLGERDRVIAEHCMLRGANDTAFPIDSLDRALALAHVLQHPASATLSEQDLVNVARTVWRLDRYAGRAAHRRVTMVPIYAPQDMKEVLAGDAAYAVAGLLSQDARRHDSNVGATAAKQVILGLDPARELEPVCLEPAPDHVRPHDSDALMRRLKVSFTALVDANLQRSGALRFFAKVPVHLRPLVGGVKRRLDRAVVRKVRRD